ncbi:MAG: DoxX family protein [Capnocytophaga sp.]|nr:DoxX family protein [Capnocytophaga sp.]
MKYIIHIVRLIVGILFIISGLIKLNDPIGFAFKLEEYFSQSVLNLPFLEPFALVIAIIVCIAEVFLGVMLLMGTKTKFTLRSLLAMLIFFGFLTFYSAYYNKVTDCGCFGDAIKFTPWQSFGKDILLLVLTLILFAGQKYITPISKGKLPFVINALTLIGCIYFVYHVYNHLPIKDFRPYKIGVNIPKEMTIPEGAPLPKYDYHWKFKVNGKEEVITTKGDYPNVQGEFISVDTEEIDKGYVPPIHDFFIEKNGENYLEEMMSKDKLLLVISYRIDKADKDAFSAIKTVTDKALKQGYTVIGLTSIIEQAEDIKKKYELNFDFYFNDETTLKTMIRSNPGVMLLQKGTIIDKKHYNDLDKLAL